MQVEVGCNAMLQSTGFIPKGATDASSSAKDSDHAAALFKLQAAQQQESKRAKAAENAIKQQEAAFTRKIGAFKAADNEAYESPGGAKKKPFYNASPCKGSKGWKNHKGQGKGQGHANSHEPSHKHHKGNHKGKGKGKVKFANKW